ncbi:MAG: DUF2330 domain-containing protein [Planctomycetes bacterium]|nr:DUF2330 domain-containing protein [Planctomycetota bacterium]MCB9936074.1 DUF2330 domain-containing protein [Planctomycetota bacterium]
MKNTVLLLAALTLLALAPGNSEACIHPPKGFKGMVDAAAQRGLVFFDNGREELVLQPGFSVNTSELEAEEYTDDGLLKNFKSFAWIVPLPALPDSYAEVEPELFTDLDKFTSIGPRIPKPERGEDDGPAIVYEDGDEGVEFFEALEVGSYSIQPIKATGEAGGKELASWLKSNGFGELDERVLRFYLQGGYYWLAVKLSADTGLPADGSVKPLQISFKTPRPVYPLKIHDKRGEFDLELWLVTREAVDLTKSRQFGIETAEQISDRDQQQNRETSYVKLPESARAIADGSAELKALRTGKVFVYRFFGRDIDADEGLDLALLQDELHWEFEKDVAPKPKEEVKPTPPDEEKKEGEKKDDEQK